jgi:succinyl-CoA synthetase alpha subunit
MIDSFVMPGQDVTDIIRSFLADENEKYIVGPGLIRDEKRTKAMKCGRLRMREKPAVFWVQSRQHRVSNFI